MKPLKNALPLAKWILKFALILFAYLSFYDKILTWDFSNIHYIIVLGITFFIFLITIGSFFKASRLTVISALIVLLLSIIEIIISFKDFDKSFILLAAISFYFITIGNNKE